jgi:hydroxylamine dehydrogenase
MFYQGDGNPTHIETSYAKMWFWYKLQGYKGYAHVQQDIMWWWGQSPMLQELGNVQSEARSMRRAAAIEKVLAEIGKPVSHFTSKSTASAEELDYEENR